MAKSKKEKILDVLGWFFLALGLITFFWYALIRDWRYAVWFCNHAMIIVGLAILKRNRFWLTAMLNWALIPVGLWIIDFLVRLLFGVHLFRITEYMFQRPWWQDLLSLQHLVTVPLMLWAMYLLGRPHARAWLGTAIHGAVLWVISYFLISPDYNINCVYETCARVLAIPNYVLWWPIIAVTIFFVTNKLLVWLFSAREAMHPRRARQRK